jgi:hypothetical protein
MTPEILRNARKARQLKKSVGAASGASAAATSESGSGNAVTSTSSRSFKEQLQAHRKPKTTSGLPSAGMLPLKVAPLPVVKPNAPTNPQPFKFATDSRVRQNSASESSREVDFLKMLRTYKPAGAASVKQFE